MEKPSQIPEKLYYKIGEVAKLIDVEPHVLRFWETEFPQISPSKSKTKQRLYRRDDVETIVMIRDLLYEKKFTIEGAKNRLREIKQKEKEARRQDQMPLGFAATSLEDDFASHADMMRQNAHSEIQRVIVEMSDYLKA